jgi:Flp pilus assembly protein TadD
MESPVQDKLALFWWALSIAPQEGTAHLNLATALEAAGQLNGAIASYKRATELSPTNVQFHHSLARGFARNGDCDEAIVSLKDALKLAPKNGELHRDFGMSLQRKGKLNEAIAAFRESVALEPANANYHRVLTDALRGKGDLNGVIAEYTEIVKRDPNSAKACYELGIARGNAGLLKEATADFKKAQQLAADNPQLSTQTTAALKRVEQLRQLEPRLQEIVKEELQPKDAAETLLFAHLCVANKYYRAAAHFYEKLASDTKPDRSGFSLSCVQKSLLAADGHGMDALTEGEKATSRSMALRWLRTYLQDEQKNLKQNHNHYRYTFQQNVRKLYDLRELAGIQPSVLSKLPDAERKEWQSFWDNVRSSLEKADVSIFVPPPA